MHIAEKMSGSLLTDISVVLFDMDGVVVDSMHHHARAWRMAFKTLGIILEDHDIFKREGMTGISSVIDIFREKGFSPPDKEVLANLQKLKDSFFEEAEIHLYPGIHEILSHLNNAGYKLGLVTGSFRRSVYHSIPVNVLSLFHAMITADDVERGKPDPEPYLKAMKKCGCSPSNVLVVENAPMGIASAKSSGARCIAVKTTLGEDYLTQSDAIINDHEELMNYFMRRDYKSMSMK